MAKSKARTPQRLRSSFTTASQRMGERVMLRRIMSKKTITGLRRGDCGSSVVISTKVLGGLLEASSEGDPARAAPGPRRPPRFAECRQQGVMITRSPRFADQLSDVWWTNPGD